EHRRRFGNAGAERRRSLGRAGGALMGALVLVVALGGAVPVCRDLHGLYFVNAPLQGADLSAADLHAAVMDGAQLDGADLRSANLSGAKVRGASFAAADLRGAIMLSTSDGADWVEAELTGALYDDATVLPFDESQ